MMTELMPCPFCGTKVRIKNESLGAPFCRYSSYLTNVTEYTIKCKKCSCTTDKCKATTLQMTDAEAIEAVTAAWNTRAK